MLFKINRINMPVLLAINILLGQNTFDEYKQQRKDAFITYKDSVQLKYSEFTKKEKEQLEQFKKEIELKWQLYKGSSKKTYVSYADDLDSRASVYFDEGYIELEVIIEEHSDDNGSLNYFHNIIRDSFLAFNYNEKSLAITSSFFARNLTLYEMQKRNSKANITVGPFLKASKKLFRRFIELISEKAEDGIEILKNQISDSSGKIIDTKASAKIFFDGIIKKKVKKGKPYTGKDGKTWALYSVKIPLQENHKLARMERYKNEIKYQSKRFDIDYPIAMAITETESSFNPKATSHIPAYGLMQLVPSTGARDAYAYVYKKDKFVSKSYLYNPKNNIELGCAYIAKIRHDYLKNIDNDIKAYMCTIAAYNTGVGNLSKALTKQPKLSPTVKKVKSLSSPELYTKLMEELEYKEARQYLKKVWSRKEKY